MWMVYAFMSALFAGITAILAKCGIKNTDSNVATALRTIVVFIFSWIMVFITGGFSEIENISSKTFLFLILSGLATGASWLCYFKALQIGDINKVTPIDKSSTVLTMILAFIFLKENINFLKIIAMIFILFGTFLMIKKKENNKEENEKKEKNSSWFWYAIFSTIFASLTSILGKIGIENIDSNLGSAIRTGVVLIMAWLMVIVTKKLNTIKNIEKKSHTFLILSGISTGSSWLFYYKALQTGSASIVVPIDKLSILVTILFSYIVFHEKLDLKSGIGLFMIVAGTLSLLL